MVRLEPLTQCGNVLEAHNWQVAFHLCHDNQVDVSPRPLSPFVDLLPVPPRRVIEAPTRLTVDMPEMFGLGLSIAGYRVDIAGDGVSALEQAGQKRLDLVVLDVRVLDWLDKSQTTPTELVGRVSAWTQVGT